MNFEFACSTDPGRIRDNNEDSVTFDQESNVAVLADGMGGYNAGEIASAMAVTFVRTELADWIRRTSGKATSKEVRRALELCVMNANQAIYNSAVSNSQFTGMGTTLVAGVFGEARVTLAHVGDSRCYLWRGGKLQQLTKDHSLLQEQIDAGLITVEQAKGAAHKNLVTRALGVEEGVLVDVAEHQPQSGDIYLMCSDGLTDMLPDSAISRVLSENGRLADMAKTLVQRANEAGGRDNISVILAYAKAESEPNGFFSRILRRN